MAHLIETPQEQRDEQPAGFRFLGVEWPRFSAWQWKVLIILTLVNLLTRVKVPWSRPP